MLLNVGVGVGGVCVVVVGGGIRVIRQRTPRSCQHSLSSALWWRALGAAIDVVCAARANSLEELHPRKPPRV